MSIRRALAVALVLSFACKPDDPPPAPLASAFAPAWSSAPRIAVAPAPASASAPLEPETPPAPSEGRISLASASALDAAVLGAIGREEVAGAVLCVIRSRAIVYRKAYGLRAKAPSALPMRLDTVFDLASLTKPLATATSILLLAEQKKLRLDDPVSRYLPSFTGDDRERVTLRHLLLHTSGLPAGDAISLYSQGKERAREHLLRSKLIEKPGGKFLYSDLGYLLLGEIVERVSAQPLSTFSKTNLFEPLGMSETMFSPPALLRERAAPTEEVKGKMLWGEAHDPRALALGGVAGHAGLFSTAEDVSRFVLMLLGAGELEGKRVLSADTVQLMTTLVPLQGKDGEEKRSLGLGPLFEGIGHTGFTGTAFWFDPKRGDGVVLLTSRLHPDGRGDVKRLRRDVASAALLLQMAPPPAIASDVRVGVDRLAERHFEGLVGRHLGLITNHTGKTSNGTRTIDWLVSAKGVEVKAIFTPEHGLSGKEDALVASGKDEKTGLLVYSLYGKAKRPSDAELSGIDTLVFDLQDAGTRFYTYISTLGITMEEAAKRGLRYVVLDRPNPLGGIAMEGPLLDPGRESFIGYHSIPIRHGMTVGELSQLFRAERKLDLDLVVVPMSGYSRGLLFEQTGLSWPVPSPNLRSARAALLYPGVGLLELTNLSVGRGTARPFEQLGAPYLDGARLASELAKAGLSGVRFSPTTFTPKSPAPFAGEVCKGVSIEVTDARALAPVKLGYAIAAALRRLSPSDWKPQGLMTLLGNKAIFDAIVRGESADAVSARDASDLQTFAARRSPHLLYK